jgi:transposase, IS6 family
MATRPAIFKWRQTEPQLILCAVRWYLRYSLSLRDVEELLDVSRRCRHRPVQYLNNIIEQDHRAIKRRVHAKQGFREFHAARRTIQGYEAMHMIRKAQVRWVRGNDVRSQIRFIGKLFELPA